MKLLLTLLSLCWALSSVAQSTQTIRGMVVDQTSQMPLIGVVILVEDTDINTTTDIDGNFVLEKVPVGRQNISTRYLGYEPYLKEGLLITAGKMSYLEIQLSEQIQTTETVVVKASSSANGVGNKALNDLSVVSARAFSVEETKRYAASIEDPGRMAAALPGIQTDQDNENDVVIRGSSAFGVLWRLEGLEIPNPSHFGRPGTTGGGVTVFSAAVLGNTDLSTGGFAAEYGNALSGVFDMRNRRGNMVEREHSIKVGLVGLGLSTEGPIKKGRSSYLVNYRYSALGILNALGLYVVRENVANTFQDLSLNLTFNSKDNKNEVKIFGMGGLSASRFFVKEDTADWLTYLDYIDEENNSNLGLLGVSFRRLLNDRSYIKVVAGSVYNNFFFKQVVPNFTTFKEEDNIVNEDYDYHTFRSQLHLTYGNKISTHFRLKTGLSFTANTYDLNYFANNQQFLEEEHGTAFITQGYVQSSYRPLQNLTLNIGFHALYLNLKNKHHYSIEPRLGLKYNPTKSTTLSAAYTWHSKVLPIGTYLLDFPDGKGGSTKPNLDLQFAKMQHVILGIQQATGKGFNINVEGYYQYGNGQPVGMQPNSGYWLFNEEENFGTQALISKGQVQNYGVDATVEKAFSRSFFILVTGSLYWSQYKTLNDVEWRRTRVDKRWSTTIMGGYEITFKKGGALQFGVKSFISGGLRYTPPDKAASIAAGICIPDRNRYFEASTNGYFRLDGRIAYRKNSKKISYTISFDVQNATNAKNLRHFVYNRREGELVPRYQSGLLPVINFQLDF